MVSPRRAALVAALLTLPLLLASCSRTFTNGAEYRNGTSFAALKADGSVVAWGAANRGGDPTCVTNPNACGAAPAGSLSSGVVDIFSSYGAYAALKQDGSLVVWGGASYGGEISCTIGRRTCHPVSQAALSSGVRTVSSTPSAFAATKTDGSVVTWGQTADGGDAACTPASDCTPAPVGSLSSGVAEVRGSLAAFAALKSDGTVVAWGNPEFGGNTSPHVGDALTDITAVVPGSTAFAAIKRDGSVVTWGDPDGGGDFNCAGSGCTAVPNPGSLSGGVMSIISTSLAECGGPCITGGSFAALKDDGSVATWGDTSSGGDSASPVGGPLTNVTAIVASDRAFAARRSDGSVVTWGAAEHGGDAACTSSATCEPAPAGSLASGVVALFSNPSAFAALKQDGSVVAWGSPNAGGDPGCVVSTSAGCVPAPPGSLAGGITQIMSSVSAFVARKADGSVVTWGDGDGAASSAPVGGALTGVAQVFSNDAAGAALKQDGSVVTWGTNDAGGNPGCDPTLQACSPAPAGSLSSGVVYIASPFVDAPAMPVPPVAPTTPPAQPNGGAAAPAAIPALPGRTTCTPRGCTTSGRVPAGATRVTQVAALTSGATQRSARQQATATSRVRGQCTISTASRTYTCTVRLASGRWAITTRALTGSTVRAQSVKRVRIARAAARRAVTG